MIVESLRRRELDTQLMDMLARVATEGKALSIQKKRKLGRSSAQEKRRWLHKKRKLDLPEERCTQRTLRQCGIDEVEELRPKLRAQVTEEEITRRAVAQMMLKEYMAVLDAEWR